MVSLTEFAQRILAELEEVGENNVFSLLNTIIEPKGNQDETAGMQEALKSLLMANLVQMRLETHSGPIGLPLMPAEAMVECSDMSHWFTFDGASGYWTLGHGDLRDTAYPQIVLTAAGRAAAVQLLSRRGYQWWRQR